MEFVSISVIICALVVCLFLVNKKLNTKHLLLFIFYVIILGVFLNYYAYFNKILWLEYVTNIIFSGTGYSIGLVIYLYVSSLFERLNVKEVVLSLIPYLTFLLVVNIPFAFSNPVDGYAFGYLEYFEPYGDEIYLIEILVFFIFIFKAFKKYQRYNRQVPLYYSSLDVNHINWVKQMLGGVLLFILIDFMTTVYLIITNDTNFPEIHVTSLSAAFVTFYITYHGLYQSEIFIPKYLIENSDNPKEKKLSKIGKSEMSQLEADELKEKLEQLLKLKKLFLRHSLTLSDLANEMGISEKKLSTFINQKLQISYYELINQYRLNEFKEQIQDPKNKIYALMALANKCGFKSKTSFYSYFKTQTGMTPAQYYKNII